MIIHGRECGFRFTIGASIAIAELCPEKDLSRMGELFEGKSYGDVAVQTAKLAAILSKANEAAVAYDGSRQQERPLSEEEIMTLTQEEFQAVQAEVLKAYGADTARTVEVEPSKKNEAEEAKSGRSS